MCNDCCYNIQSGVCPIYETDNTNIYSKNEEKNLQKYRARSEFINVGEKFWIKR